ncbi:MAG: phosphate acyltransferase, partial [Pseudomonadota bacterium]
MDKSTLVTMIKKRFSSPQTVIFPEGNNIEIQTAARQLRDDDLAKPVLIGNNIPSDLPQIATHTNKQDYADALQLRKPKYTQQQALQMLDNPINYAAAHLSAGYANAMVAGIDHPTSDVIRAGLTFIGTKAGFKTASSLFMMQFSDRPALFFADCAFNAFPNAQMLCDIAIASADSACALTRMQSKIAMLAFSSHGSASHESLEKIIAATTLVKQQRSDLVIDGEVQADAALVPQLAVKKLGEDNLLQGQANVLIFPDLNSGNIAYKLVQYLANAKAVGPMLQGFAHPICDLS